MKKKMIVAAGLAACMTMSVAASAVELPNTETTTSSVSTSVMAQTKQAIAAQGIMNQPQAISVYAGDTVKGVAHIVQEDGNVVDKPFSAVIPVSATNAEMSNLTSQAAQKAAGLTSVARGTFQRKEFARSYNNGSNTMTIQPSGYGAVKMCSGTIPASPDSDGWNYIELNFFNIYNLSKLNVRAVNESWPSSSTNRNCYQTININGDTDIEVYFYSGNTYGQGQFKISAGAAMSIYASSGTTATGLASCIAYVISN